MILEPTTIDELQEAVRSCAHAIPLGAGTKPALSSVPDKFRRISTLHLSGIVEYDPSEFTITVLAGTRLTEIEKALGEHSQYLPFDPPLAEAGATIGGTVAAGLSGPGAFRFGPIRDFLIGVKFVDGEGTLISGGGKVVKNAAGFDLPKFLIGSCGTFGVLAELTFKVFPRPEASVTVGIAPASSEIPVQLLARLSKGPFDLDALEYDPVASRIRCRLSGNVAALKNRVSTLEKQVESLTIWEPNQAVFYWKRLLSFDWSNQALAKMAITPEKICEVEAQTGLKAQYSMGGNLGWIDGPARSIATAASVLNCPIQFIRPLLESDEPSPGFFGLGNGETIRIAIKNAFDPGQKFPAIQAATESLMNEQ